MLEHDRPLTQTNRNSSEAGYGYSTLQLESHLLETYPSHGSRIVCRGYRCRSFDEVLRVHQSSGSRFVPTRKSSTKITNNGFQMSSIEMHADVPDARPVVKPRILLKVAGLASGTPFSCLHTAHSAYEILSLS